MVNIKRLEDDTLTKDVLLKAKRELGETDEAKDGGLKSLRDLVLNEEGFHCSTSSDFLLKFLRHKKFDVAEAFGAIKRYYAHRWHYPSLYSEFSPKDAEATKMEKIVTFLPSRTEDGCAVWAIRLGLWDPSSVSFEDLLKFGLMCHEVELLNPLTQINGIVSIINLEGFSWSHIFAIPFTKLRCLVSASQDCLPMRHKSLHVINYPSIFGIVYSAMKPLIKPMLRKRIHFHSDISDFHSMVPIEILPSEFGGSNGPFGNAMFYSKLLNSSNFFQETMNYGFTIPPKTNLF